MQVPMLPVRFLRRAAQIYANKPAIVCSGESYTYGVYRDRVNQLSHALERLGVRQGDRVAYLALNCHRLLEGYYGVPQIGAILLCLNIRLGKEEVAFILNDAQPRVLVLSHMMVPVWEAIADRCPSVEHVLLMEGPLADHNWPGYDEAIAGEPTTPPAEPKIDENDVAELFYTSGTTGGEPKGVMLTYRNLYAHALQAILGLDLSDGTVQVVGTVPLFHVNAWGSPHYLVALGATQVVVPRFDPQMFCEAVQRYHATNALLVPTMLNALLNFPRLGEYDLSSLVRIMLGGAATPYSLIEQGREALKCECLVGYGLSETSPILTVATLKSTLKELPAEEKDRIQAMTGLPLIGIELEILDDEGNPVAHDGQSRGEICVRGDSVMKGYWNRPRETTAAFEGGWFHTGDVAVIDSEGYVNIVDRKKDIIISGGENISSAAIEDAIYRHPAVLEAAAIGVPDPRWGETPKAIVVLKPGQSLTEEELIQFLRQYLAGFEVPRSVDFVDELPKTGTGKVIKHELRKRYWQGHESAVV
jgi:fatty-acyl-CoA synthase